MGFVWIDTVDMSKGARRRCRNPRPAVGLSFVYLEPLLIPSAALHCVLDSLAALSTFENRAISVPACHRVALRNTACSGVQDIYFVIHRLTIFSELKHDLFQIFHGSCRKLDHPFPNIWIMLRMSVLFYCSQKTRDGSSSTV
jgi:hypothetical protein